MLIEAPYKVGDTVSVKLSSGEEIIGRLDAEDSNTITLNKPMAIMATQQGIGLAPFMFSVSQDTKLKFNNNQILVMVKTMQDISNQYTQSTTGIAVA